MRRTRLDALAKLAVLGICGGAALGAALALLGRAEADLPDPPAVATRIREVARLEVLEVALYKKITFAPEPQPADSIWGDLAGWLRHTFDAPRGKAIVFADARLGLDLERLDAESVHVSGRVAHVVLPPVRTTIVLRPGETEVIGSNLDSAETARLLELALGAFEREVERDPALRDRARAGAERAIRGLLATLGFSEVRFVDRLPPGVPSS